LRIVLTTPALTNFEIPQTGDVKLPKSSPSRPVARELDDVGVGLGGEGPEGGEGVGLPPGPFLRRTPPPGVVKKGPGCRWDGVSRSGNRARIRPASEMSGGSTDRRHPRDDTTSCG